MQFWFQIYSEDKFGPDYIWHTKFGPLHIAKPEKVMLQINNINLSYGNICVCEVLVLVFSVPYSSNNSYLKMGGKEDIQII